MSDWYPMKAQRRHLRPWAARTVVWSGGAFRTLPELDSEVRSCPHNHTTPELARKCSEAMARRLNREGAEHEI